jgi:hypothetical protein
MYVVIKNVKTSDLDQYGSFYINDSKGNKIQAYSLSGYYSKSSSVKLRDYTSPPDGSTLDYIRGVVCHYSSKSKNIYEIIPLYPNDIKISSYAPVASSIKRNIDVVSSGQAVKVSTKITDVDGTITDAKLYYHINGGVAQTVDLVANAAPDNNIYTATIPGVKDSSLVDYFIWAKDNDGNTGIAPDDTARSKYFYLVLSRPLTIQDIQYSPFGGGYGGYTNYHVTLSGVVTADTSDIVGDQNDGGSVARRVYIQNGSGPWSGIWIYGGQVDALKRGDNVTVKGVITENNYNTRLDTLSSLVVNSSGNVVPDPVVLSTSEIGTLTSGTVSAEKYEGVLVEYKNVKVTNQNPDGSKNFGEILVADASNVGTRIELQEGNHPYHNNWDTTTCKFPGNIKISTGNSFSSIKGVLYYSFGNYKMVPRKTEDFSGFTTGVSKEKNSVVKEYNLSQNYPNPFNPSTTIEYSIIRAGNVSLDIYNLLGQKVKTLINSQQNAGTYKVIFNANDLTSGIYFYQLNSGSFKQVKKMLLLK